MQPDTRVEPRTDDVGDERQRDHQDRQFDHHWNSALEAGLRREQLEQLADAETSDAFDERERAIVRYAREATMSLEVSDETWSTLRGHFSMREAMDVVMAVAWYTAVARMLLPMEIETEDWLAQDR
jgi:alkylhydroperoxidase family enzyme